MDRSAFHPNQLLAALTGSPETAHNQRKFQISQALATVFGATWDSIESDDKAAAQRQPNCRANAPSSASTGQIIPREKQ
jgi:hypothetical protein